MRQIPKEFENFKLSGANVKPEDQDLVTLLNIYSHESISVKQALMHEDTIEVKNGETRF